MASDIPDGAESRSSNDANENGPPLDKQQSEELQKTPMSEADKRQWEEDRAQCQRLLERLENPKMIVRFLDRANGTINGRPIYRGTVAEIDTQTALELFDYRPMGLPAHEWPASIEVATKEDLLRYEALMLEADANEQATANDPLSQRITLERYDRERNKQIAQQEEAEARKQPWVKTEIVAPNSPHLIVRFLELGTFGSHSCSIGEVWPVDKERALYLLLNVPPVVELATPDELKRDREIIKEIETRRKRWNQLNGQQSGPFRLIVRFVRPGKNSFGDNCDAREVWEVEEEHAYGLLRGRIPIGELATEADLKAYIAKLGAGSEAVEKPDQTEAGSKTKPVKLKKSTLPGEADSKLIPALSIHHKYLNGSCLNYDPIGSNALARLADVGRGSATNFFNKYFDGFPAYKKACHLRRPLANKLTDMNGDTRDRREASLPDEI